MSGRKKSCLAVIQIGQNSSHAAHSQYKVKYIKYYLHFAKHLYMYRSGMMNLLYTSHS